MFVGEFRHTIDAKNRLVIPSKFRAFLSEKAEQKGFFVLASTVRSERCLRLYTISGWKLLWENLRRYADNVPDPAKFMRYYASRGEFATVDAQSRIVIPQKLLDYVGLKKEVLLVGNFQWIEVWNFEEYGAATESLDEEIGDPGKPLWSRSSEPGGARGRGERGNEGDTGG